MRIRTLNDRSDCALWRISVVARINAKSYSDTFHRFSSSSERDEVNGQPRNIIGNSLSDQPSRIVSTTIGKLAEMLTKMDSRYDPKTTTSRIAKILELVSTRYGSLNEDISAHVDRLDGLVKQLKGMNTSLEEFLAIGILVDSIDVTELLPVT